MHNFRSNYEKIVELLKGLGFEGENFIDQIRKPKLSDLRIMALTVTAEYMGIDSEHQLFRALPSDFRWLSKGAFITGAKEGCFFTLKQLGKNWQPG